MHGVPKLGMIKVLVAVDWTVAPGLIRLLILQQQWGLSPLLRHLMDRMAASTAAVFMVRCQMW